VQIPRSVALRLGKLSPENFIERRSETLDTCRSIGETKKKRSTVVQSALEAEKHAFLPE
jgi:hypothetical protein